MRLPLLKTALQAALLPEISVPVSSSNHIIPAATNATFLPGGTPLKLCPASSPTDLFQITSVELTKQPIYFDDVFLFHTYGVFRDTWSPDGNATLNVGIDCGSHCDIYGVPPGTGESGNIGDFCEFTDVEQPLSGRKKDRYCPPEPGYALLSNMGYVFPMFIRAPGWYNFTFDAKTADGKRIYCMTAEVCLRWEDKKNEEGYPKGPWSNCTWPY